MRPIVSPLTRDTFMNDGATAVSVKQVDFQGSRPSSIHVSMDTEAPPLGTLFGADGEVIPSHKKGLMETLDEKTSKRIEISQGTAWVIGIAFILLQVLFNYGSSWITSARADQTQTEQITALTAQISNVVSAMDKQALVLKTANDELRNDFKALDKQVEDLRITIQAEAIRRARSEGYQRGEQP